MVSKFYVYCLYSDSHKKIYIGQTNNLDRRLKQHELGKVESTKSYRPYRLIYFEEYVDRNSAVKREKELKGSRGRRFLRGFIR
jgi:putative endonuclease